MLSPELIKKILAVKEEGNGDAALDLLGEIVIQYATGESGGEPPPDPTAAASDPPPSEEEQAMTALSREIVALTGAASAGEASTRIKEIVSAHTETEARARTLEASERRGLVANLVQLGAETPATAWTNVDAVGDARAPVKRLADEPIAELRSRVEALTKANPRVRVMTPTVGSDPKAKPLSREARAYCTKHGISEADYRSRMGSAVRRST